MVISRLFVQKLHFNIQDSDQEANYEQSVLSQRLVDLCSGSIAGATQVIVAQPFDTVKVKEQAFPKMYKSMFDCFVKTYRTEGVLHGLYAGSLPALMANVGENAVLLVAYESCRRFVAALSGLQSVESLPIVGEALAGGLSTSFSTFIVCPTELIKCRMQAMNELKLLAVAKNKPPPAFLSMAKLIRNIYCAEGVPGFYRGIDATFARDCPGYFCFFGCYEALKEWLKQPSQTRAEVGPLVTIAAAGVAGIFLYTVSFPADVIKSRIQINNLRSSVLSVGRNIIHTDGVGALYHGLVPTIIQTIPATATLFLVYEFIKKRLNNMLQREEKRSK